MVHKLYNNPSSVPSILHNLLTPVTTAHSELDVEMNKIFGARSSDVLKRMQKAMLSSPLDVARTVKVITPSDPDGKSYFRVVLALSLYKF